MRKAFLVLLILLHTACATGRAESQAPHAAEDPPIWVAHAAGGIQGVSDTNSLEALEENYRRGFRYFEIDFEWTRDGHLVAIHDWDNAYRKNFNLSETSVPALEEFMDQKMANGWTPLSLETLNRWLDSHPDARIITDIKSRNVEGLANIRASQAQNLERYIPQIYFLKEYGPARHLGFERIVLTLYRKRISDAQILAFCEKNTLFALTLWADWALESDLAERLKDLGVPVYAHTVNDSEQWEALQAKGVTGIYTDFLSPD